MIYMSFLYLYTGFNTFFSFAEILYISFGSVVYVFGGVTFRSIRVFLHQLCTIFLKSCFFRFFKAAFLNKCWVLCQILSENTVLHFDMIRLHTWPKCSVSENLSGGLIKRLKMVSSYWGISWIPLYHVFWIMLETNKAKYLYCKKSLFDIKPTH